MQLPYADDLEIQYLSRLFDNKSECYKLFWFQAIITKITKEHKDTISFEELIDEMVADAWYMVSEYHLNLGPKDNLEAIVLRLQELTKLKSSEKKSKIIEAIHDCSDREVLRIKKVLTYNVPYRLQAPFMIEMKGDAWKVPVAKLAQRINQQKRLMYYFSEFAGLETAIIVEPRWIDYIMRHQEILLGWLQYNMIIYLQKRNPSVPGISDKLYPPQERKLQKVGKYWKMIMDIYPIHEIYGNNELSKSDISIDHFVPWSYVAHDEFWNLHPTTKGINSSKSNGLPDWNKYFHKLCKLEYLSYQLIWTPGYERLRHEFDLCAKDHLNSEEIRWRLYKEGLSETEFSRNLQSVIQPVYQSAMNMGFKNWIY